MPATRFVTINELTGKIVGVGTGIASQVGEPPLSHRHIFEAGWAVTSPLQDPAIGDEWDGQDPTTFSRPVVDPDALPATAQDAWDNIQTAKAEVTAAEAVFATMQGLSVT